MIFDIPPIALPAFTRVEYIEDIASVAGQGWCQYLLDTNTDVSSLMFDRDASWTSSIEVTCKPGMSASQIGFVSTVAYWRKLSHHSRMRCQVLPGPRVVTRIAHRFQKTSALSSAGWPVILTCIAFKSEPRSMRMCHHGSPYLYSHCSATSIEYTDRGSHQNVLRRMKINEDVQPLAPHSRIPTADRSDAT
jgi:hypothetical protein